MLEKLALNLNRLARGKIIAVVALLILPFNLFAFPKRTAILRGLSGEKSPTLDVRFSYDPATVYDWMGKLGPTGRQLYAASELSLDLAYPILYNLLLALLMATVFRRAFPSGSRLQKLPLLPGVTLLADYLENLGVVLLLLNYPRQLPALARLASLFSSTKWVFGAASAGLILLGLAALLLKKLASRPGEAGA